MVGCFYDSAMVMNYNPQRRHMASSSSPLEILLTRAGSIVPRALSSVVRRSAWFDVVLDCVTYGSKQVSFVIVGAMQMIV